MPTSKKPAGKATLKGAQSVDKIFSKIGEKTGMDKKKVDAWQKKWLAIPKNRTKYESIKDAPAVMGEEIFAMSNDIIEFCQGEHAGDSQIFAKIKAEAATIKKDPKGYFEKLAKAGKEKAMKAKAFIEEKSKAAKGAADKASKAAKKATKK